MKTLFLFLAVLLANTAFAQIQPSESNDLDGPKYRILTEAEREALATKGLHVVTTTDDGLPDDWVEVSIEEREALANKGFQVVTTTDEGLPDDWEFADEATIAKLVEAGYWKENASTKTGAWADGQAGSIECNGDCSVVRRKSDPKQYAIVCRGNNGVLQLCCIRKLF